jgi:uncharacterized membrane protein YfcA
VINVRALLASPLGFLIGLSLGALGGGGSILAVPALVYGAGQTSKQATTTSLILVGITAIIGIIPHWHAGRVRIFAGTIFGLAGIGGSLLGSRWNKAVDPDVLLLAFSGLMLIAAFAMWRRTRAASVGPVEELAEVDLLMPEFADPEVVSVSAAATNTVTSIRVTPLTVFKVAIAGSFVGLLTGFFGVGGGFIIVPALVLALGFTMPEAVGTSLLVIAINSATALGSRLQSGSIEWAVILPFLFSSLLGLGVGTRLAGTRDSKVLQIWFVYLLVGVALYTAGQSLNAIL